MKALAYEVGDQPSCTCGPWLSILPPPPCPVHNPIVWVVVPVYPSPHPVPWVRGYYSTTTSITVNTKEHHNA